MAQAPLSRRSRYRPTLRVSGTVAGYGILLLVAAALLAVVLDLAYLHGFFFIFLTPLAVALALGGLLLLVVARAQIRHPLLAGVAGVLLGVLMYLGHFQVGLVREVHAAGGGLAWERVDLLPEYIAWRMEHQTVRDSHRTPSDREETPSPIGNWLLFAAQLVASAAVVAAVGVARTRRPFGERAGRWLDRQGRLVPAGSLAAVLKALEDHDAPALGRLLDQPEPLGYPQLALAYDHAIEMADEAAYLSIKIVTGPTAKSSADPLTAPGQLVVDRIRLDAEEYRVLIAKWAVAQLQADPAQAPTPPGPGADMPAVGAPAAHRLPLPMVRPAGAIRHGRGWWINALLRLCPALLLAAAAAMAIVGLVAGFAAGWGWTWGIALLASGLIAGAAVIAGMANRRLSLAHRRIDRLLRQAVAARPDRLLDPAAPGLWLVDIIPRERWMQGGLDPAAEVGLLRLVPGQGILFEGECERWRCPVEAVQGLALVDVATSDPHGGGELLTFVVLRLRDEHGATRELPLRERTPAFLFSPTPPRQRTAELFAAIQALVQPSVPEAVQPPPPARALTWGTWTKA